MRIQLGGNYRARRPRARGSFERPRHHRFAAAGQTVLEHARMWLLPDGRVVVVLISPGGNHARQNSSAAPAVLTQRTGRHRRVFESPLFRLDARGHSWRPAAKAGHRSRALRGNRAERSDVVRSRDAGRRAIVARSTWKVPPKSSALRSSPIRRNCAICWPPSKKSTAS